MKKIDIGHLPTGWNDCSVMQLKSINDLGGKYKSMECYMSLVFFALMGIKPLVYAERWRELMAKIPLLRPFLAKTGRQIDSVHEDFLGMAKPFVLYKSCFHKKGFWNALFGKRFWLTDEEVLSFAKRISWVDTPPFFLTNPVAEKRIEGKTYKSSFTRLADMRWADYNQCCALMDHYAKSGNKLSLRKFISTLYKLPSENLVDKAFSPFEISLIILFWESVQKDYARVFPHLFKKKKSKKAKKEFTDYMKMEAEMTVFIAKEASSIPNQVHEMEAFYALEYMEKRAVENERLEQIRTKK